MEALTANYLLPVAVAATLAMAALVHRLVQVKRDERLVYNFLSVNTADQPHQSHKSTEEISSVTLLPEARVARACLNHPDIFRSDTEPNLWSIWRSEPESVYDRRGLISF
jgi:hypothetical protein